MIDLKEIINKIQEKHSRLPDECVEELIQKIKIKSCSKNEIIVKEGQYAKTVYFILKGVVRAFYYVDEKDITDWFAVDNEFIAPIVSFFSERPSPHYIQVLQDSVLVEINQETVNYLSEKYHDFEKLIRLVVTDTMLRQQKRISSILFFSAENKYLQLLEDYPGIVDKVPLKHLASHLGMTLETLSRIRNNVKLI